MRYYLLALMALTLSINKIHAQQNGITKYELNNKQGSWPNRFVAGENRFYFEAVDSGKVCLWTMDGNSAPQKLYFSNKYLEYIAPIICIGDDVLLGMNYDAKWHICKYNHAKKSITELYSAARGHEFLMAEKDNLYFATLDTGNNKRIVRININTGSEKTLIYTGNMYVTGMTKVRNNYYVCASYGLTGNIYATDTVAKSITHMLVPHSNNKNDIDIKMFNIDDVLYFFTSTEHYHYQLYRYKGPPYREAEKITELLTNEKESRIYSSTNVVGYNGKIYFSGPMYDRGISLLAYDTTFNIVETAYPRAFDKRKYPPFEPSDFHIYKTRLYMNGNDTMYRPQLFTYSGIDTPWQVAHIQDNYNSNYKRIDKKFFTFKGDLYFAAADEIGEKSNVELYRYNDSLPDIIVPKEQDAPSTIYPNPTRFAASLYIQLEEKHTIQVVIKDISGIDRLSTEPAPYGPGKHVIDLPTYDLEKGLYFYNVIGNNKKVIAKGRILKQ